MTKTIRNLFVLPFMALVPTIAAWGQAPTITSGPDLGIWPLGEVQIPLTAVGGNGTYAWDITSGTLSAGLAIRTDVPSGFGSAQAGIIGVATTQGTASFTLRVTSGGLSATQPVTLRITSLTSQDENRLPDGFVGVAYSYTFTPVGNTGAVRFSTSINVSTPGSVANPFTLTAGGQLSGTPTAAGNYSVSLSFTDQTTLDTSYQAFNISVSALQITSPGLLPDAVQNSAYNYRVTAHGGDGNYSFSANCCLPNGLSIDPSTGVISGTVSSGQNKSIFWVTVSDPGYGSYSKVMVVDVTGVTSFLPNQNPYNNFFDDCIVGSFCSRNIGNGGGVTPFTWTVTGLPSGMAFRPYNAPNGPPSNYLWPGDVELYGTPLVTGDFSVTVTVTDANSNSSTQVYPLHVSNLVVDPGTMNNGTQGTPYSFTFRIVGGTGPYAAQYLDSQSNYYKLPYGLSLSGLTVSGTPAETGGFGPRFDFTDSAGGSLTTPSYLYISGTSPITANPFSYNPFYLAVNQSFSFQLCCTGYTFSETGSLPNGLTFTTDGLLSGTPTTVGTYPILVTASNSSGTGTGEIILIVSPISVTTNNSLPFGNVGVFYSQSLSASGGTGSLSWTLFPGNYLPPGLSIVGSTLAGTPTGTGQFNFGLIVTDSAGSSQLAYFTVAIYANGAFPPLSINQNPNLGSNSIGPIYTPLSASGATGAYTWSLNAGSTLPPGCALRTDMPPWFPSSASAGILCVATTPGNYSFTVTVTSGTQSLSQLFTMRISNLLVMDGGLPDAFVNRPYSYTFTPIHADGTPAGAVTYSSPNVPPGMTFSNGTLSGTPTTSGYYNVSFTMSDGVDTMGRSFGIGVFQVHIDSPGVLPNATEYAAYSYTFTASGGTAPYTFSVGGLPNGLSLDNATGEVTGTINQGAGPWGFDLTATDSNQVSYVKTMAIDVIGVPPTLPWIPSIGINDCSVGVGCERSVSVFDGGTAPFTWSATGLPPGVGFRFGSGGDNGNMATYVMPTNAELWGIPTQAGSYNIMATVTDANGVSTSQNLALHVSPLFIDAGFATGTYNVPYSSTMQVVGGSGSYALQVVPGNGTFPDGTALNGFTLSGTPVENGNFSELMVISDTTQPSHNTLTQYVGQFIAGAPGTTIQINNSDIGTFLLGNSVYYGLSACCVPSYTWTLVGGSLPPGNPAFTLSPSGLITGTPNTSGTYAFLVQAADQINPANFARRLVTITVSPISISSINGNPLPYGTVSVPYSQPMSATGGVGTITWSVMPGNSLPPGLNLNPATGMISGTPSATGQYSFSVMAADTAGNSASGWFTINIYAFGSGPPLSLNLGPNLGTWTIGSVPAYELNATGGAPPYTYSLTPAATNIPGMRVLNGPPLPTYFPATVTGGFAGLLASAGTFSTSIRVTDSVGTFLDQPIDLTVLPLTILTSNPLPKATMGQPYTFQFTGYGGSGSYSWTAFNLPTAMSGFAFSGGTPGQLVGTPTSSGNFNFTVTITDLSDNTQISYGFNLTVNPFAITNNAVLPIGTAGTPYLQTLTAPGCGAGCTWTTSYLFGLSLEASNSSTAVGSCVESSGVTCRIAGTPTGYNNGSITVTATGSNGAASTVLALEILSPAQPLTMSTTSLGNITVGNSVATQLTALGGSPPYSWMVAGGSLPPGVSLAGPGEALGANFTPGFTYLWGRAMVPGSYNFTLKVTDASSNSVSQSFSWYIQQTTLSYSFLPVNGVPLVIDTAYSQSLLGLGGTGTYTFSVTSTTNPMPPGLTLGPSGVVSGTPLNSGSYNVPIQMIDSAGNVLLTTLFFNIGSGTASTINIGAGPFLGTLQLGSTTSFNLNPSGGTGPYTFSVPTTSPATPSNALPPGCVLSFPAPNNYLLTCLLIGPGTYSVLLEVQDSAGNVGYKTLTLAVAPFTLYSSSLQNATVGVPYSDTLPLWDDTGTVSLSLAAGSALPPGLTISGTTISGTPTTAGNYSFTLSATDASGAVVNYGFNLVVSTLQITDPQALPIADVGAPYSFTFHATGGTAALTWSASGLLYPLTLSPTTGVLSGTPTSVNTSSAIQVTVTDGHTSYTKAFTLWIRNQYPQPLDFSLTGAQLADASVGQSYAAALLPTGGLPPAYWTLVPGFSLPPGLSLATGASLSPSLIPNATYLAGAPSTVGFYTFDMIMTDTAGNQTRRTFTLNVSPLQIVPSYLLSATEGVAYNQQLTAIGGTPPYTFSYRTANLGTPTFPPGITSSPSGAISGTPTSGGYSYLYVTVADSAGHTFTTTLYLDVLGPAGTYVYGFTSSAGGPGWTAGLFAYGYLYAYSTSGSATYSYSLHSGSLPPGLTLGALGPNTIGGAPSTPGPYNFMVRATNTSNPADFADYTFSGTISPMMAIVPKQEIPAGRIGTPYTFSFRMVGGTAPYTFQESPLYPIPPGLTLSANGTLSGTPQVSGTFNFYATVTDSIADSMTASLGTMNILASGAPNPMTPLSGAYSASVGVPSAFELDALVRGGAPPYTWAVAADSSLPPGMSIAPGSNGVSSYLVGIPSAAGNSTVTLTATDAGMQSVPVTLYLTIGLLSATPAVLPNGVVGSPYSAALSVSGGAAPYAISLSYSDLPVGLTMSPAGVLSGTPQLPGIYSINVLLTDSAAPPNAANATFTVGIDRAGQAPAIGISPAATQMSYVLTGPGPSPVTVNITDTSAGLPYTAMVSGIPGASLSAVSGSAPDTLSLSLNPAGLTAGVYAGVVAVNSATSTNVYQGVPFVLTVSNPPPCTYSLSSNTGSVASAAGTGSFGMATGSLCAWTATVPSPADQEWLTIASGGGTGPGSVSFNVTANAGTDSRVGTILAGGQNYQVTQFGSACSLAISPSAINVTAAGGVATINISSNGACPWTATGLGATPASGSGNGQVQVTIPSTTSGNPPQLTATIAGQTFTVTQSGVACVASLDATSASYGPLAGAGSVNVTIPSGCSYSTVPGPTWITVTSNGSGSGPGPVNLAYTVDAASTTVARSGALTIGGQTYQISQSGIACGVTVDASASGSPYGSVGGSGTIAVTANGPNCSWTASSAAAWASVTPSSGTGSATLAVNTTSNVGSASSRNTTFTIAGTNVAITESGIDCSYALGSTTGSVPSTGGNGTVGVITPAVCAWSASSTPGDWVTITPANPANSSGSGDVSFTASPNPSALPRSTTFTAAGITYTLSQAGAPCSYSLSSTNTTVAAAGFSGSYGFTAAPGCSATALSYSNWITVTTASAPDGSSGTVNYTVAANAAGGSRTGYIELPGASFTITQTSAVCAYSLNTYGQAFATIGGPGSILGSPSEGGCVPSVGSTQPSIVTVGTLSPLVLDIFTLPYAVSQFKSLTPAIRYATITFGGQLFAVKQSSW